MIHCCKKCGALLEDEATVCDFCGTVLELANTTQTAPQTAEPVAEEAATIPQKRSPKKKLLIVGSIVLGVIAIAVAFFLLFYYPSTPAAATAAVDKYFSVVLGNADRAESLAPEEYWIKKAGIHQAKEAYLERQIEYIDAYYASWTNSRKEAYGDDFTFEYQVIDTELLTGDEADAIANALGSEYDISEHRISFIYRLFVKTTTKGSVKKDVYARQVYAVRIGSEWYLVHYYDGGGGAPRIFFLVGSVNDSLLL